MFKNLKLEKLKALISELEGIRGRHTELVSVYIPAGFNLAKVVTQLKLEQSTAQNIKSKTVRKNVLGALEKILQHLKLYRQTPEHGIAIFCGNVSDKEGVTDLELWCIEPSEPIKNKLYWCGQNFILDPLLEIVKEKELYGLIVLDKSEAEIGILKGKKIQTLKHLESIVPGKSKKGGQSAQRFARIREGLLHDFLKKIGDVASTQLKEYKDLKGIIIGGPGPIKEQFADGDFLAYDVKNKVIGMVNTSYTGVYGLRELVERSEEILSESSVIKEKKILDRFFGEFERDSGLGIYGFHEVYDALKSGNVEILLLSETFDWVKTGFECTCGFKTEKILKREQINEQKCPECNAKLEVKEEKDITDDVIKLAEEMDTKIEIISVHTQRGEQLKELGGIAGILRYKL
jgi:peptide chain release factor subunit 1